MTKLKSSFILFIVFLVSFSCNDQQVKGTVELPLDTLFTMIDSSDSGINFINLVEDQADFNILNYRNFYNGGGVALGDVNNDGLVDIYFTSNQQGNKLYLNQGNFQFLDVTEIAKVGGEKSWSTGTTMVDINADGWLDIYVCNSGDASGGNKANELFVNQKDGTFIESAAAWKLDDQGYSTHASFFDYDQDGDLDCYLLNNSFKSPDKIELYKRSRNAIDTEGGDKLLKNEGDHFINVSAEAGIYSSDIGFGLGVSVGDLNGDMLPDIYVSNDFWERDYFYRNLGNGNYVEELTQRFAYISLNSMGADIGDLNNDGHSEIMTTDMLPADSYRRKTMTQFDSYRLLNSKKDAGYHVQLMQNALHMNHGDGGFSEVAYQQGLAATDWSWGTLFWDFNNDGFKDIFVSNGISRDLTDFDFVEYISDDENVKAIVKEKGRADFRDYLPFMPSTPLANYGYLNNKGRGFSDASVDLGLTTPSFSNGAAYGDLDNDGDLDLVVNNANMEAFLYRNNSDKKGNNYLKVELKGGAKNPNGIGARIIAICGSEMQQFDHYLSRGFQSSVAPNINIGLGIANKVDTLKVIWPDLKMQTLTQIEVNSTISLDYKNANQKFVRNTGNSQQPFYAEITEAVLNDDAVHKENEYNDFDIEILLPHQISNDGPEIIVADVNNDDIDDFLQLGATDQTTKLFIQNQSGSFDSPFQEAIFFDQGLEASCGAFLDYDADGDLDLLVGHGGNEIEKGRLNFGLRFYKNDGQGMYTDITSIAPPAGGNLSCIEVADIDNDGDEDIFFGGRSVPGNYGLIPASYLVLNEGKGNWANVTFQELGQLGMVTGAKWTDIDADGDMDLIAVGEWMPITIFENTDGQLKKSFEIPNSTGWWQDITIADLDNDGDDDYVLGNWGENSFLQASSEQPLKMYVKDFDGNGKTEFIIEKYDTAEGRHLPIASRSDIMKQLPSLKKKNTSYADYAKKSYVDLFTARERKGAKELITETLKTSILWNTDSGFKLEALPQQAQTGPVLCSLTEDFNKDGLLDLLLMGNIAGVQPELGRQMGNEGTVLLGMGDRTFSVTSNSIAGIRNDGELRSISKVKGPSGKERVVIGVNNEALRIYEETSKVLNK